MIDVANLSVTLSDKPILENYSLSVGQGDVLAILGANGVGKTTLLNCIVGLARPSAGTATSRGRIGYVPQLFHSTFAFSVLDIVLMGRARHIGLFGAPRRLDYEIAQKYLDQMKVGHLRDRPFNELSGGQRQLVMIAQALSSECEILILDEPCSALDYKNQSIVIDTLRALNDGMGLTIVFSTHAPQHGLEVASHVLLMRDRKRYEHGRVDDVLTAANLSALYDVPIAKASFADNGRFTFAPSFGR
jgi:iron complex transport system ATP-binding protein